MRYLKNSFLGVYNSIFQKKTLFVLATLAFSFNESFASFYEDKARGWFWYEDPLLKKEETDEKETEKPAEKARKYVETIKKDLEDKKHIALASPTSKNVYNYMEAQKKMMDRSELFSKKWLEVLFKNPDELDYTVKHPTMQAARHIAIDEKKKTLSSKIKALSETYGLFFFFAGNCSFCHGFAPIVKVFSEKYGWDVLAISLDGGSVKEFPDAKPNNGIAQNLQVKSLPTLMAVDPKSGKVLILSVGMSSIEKIEERLDVLMQSGEM